MPELPEVEITKEKLKPLIGKTCQSFWSDWPRGLRVTRSVGAIDKDIRGRKVVALRRKGKVILFTLSKEKTLAFHQRMSGRFISREKKDAVLDKGKHTRVAISFYDGNVLYFVDPRKFGVCWYGNENDVLRDPFIASLGPDALTVKKAEFVKLFSARVGKIKHLLLRQNIISGAGNIVADEALWRAKIHPECYTENMDARTLGCLHSALAVVLKRSLKSGGTTLRDWGHPDGDSGKFQKKLWVYGRAGLPCIRCKNKITRIVVSGRGTHVCSNCQPR